MALAQETVIEHLCHALIQAANSPELRKQNREVKDDGDSATKWYEALAAATYEHLPEGVRKVIGRKLVPGLREVNKELRKSTGKVVVFMVEYEEANGDTPTIARVYLEDASLHPLICTNCERPVPDDAERCPHCGAP